MIALRSVHGETAMIEQGSIILTSHRPDLQAALAEAFAGLRVIESRADSPQPQLEGRIWCFIDWLLPEISGLEMCRRLRDDRATAHAHITIVLEEDDSEARRRSLRAGADDYLVGPLTPARLVQRLRQYGPGGAIAKAPARLTHGDLALDLAAHQVRWRGRPIVLRPNEFRLLAHFIDHPDQLFSRSGLIATLGKDCDAIDERTVDVWVGRLRRSLKAHGVPDPLRTVRSMGYVLDGMADGNWREAS